MEYFASLHDKQYHIEINSNDAVQAVKLNGKKYQAELLKISDTLYSLIIDNFSHQLFIEQSSQGYVISIHGAKYKIDLEDERTHQIRQLIKSDEKSRGQTEIKAPMPGLIVSVNVKEGQEIKKGEALFIIEAMKMENEIRATDDGVIKKILKKERDSVEKDAILMVME